MAGSLVQVAKSVVTVATPTSSLLGIDDTSPYLLTYHSIKTSNDSKNMRFRVTKASDSSADTTANYDFSSKTLRTDTTFNTAWDNGVTSWSVSNTGTGTSGHEVTQGIVNLYNFFDASEYPFTTYTVNYINSSGVLFGQAGGGNHQVAQSCNGVQFFEGSGDTFTGVFTLYKVV